MYRCPTKRSPRPLAPLPPPSLNPSRSPLRSAPRSTSRTHLLFHKFFFSLIGGVPAEYSARTARIGTLASRLSSPPLCRSLGHCWGLSTPCEIFCCISVLTFLPAICPGRYRRWKAYNITPEEPVWGKSRLVLTASCPWNISCYTIGHAQSCSSAARANGQAVTTACACSSLR